MSVQQYDVNEIDRWSATDSVQYSTVSFVLDDWQQKTCTAYRYKDEQCTKMKESIERLSSCMWTLILDYSVHVPTCAYIPAYQQS